MKYTNNLNLKKPEPNDFFDQENHANYNMDVIDSSFSLHLADDVKHITSSERAAWNGKQNVITGAGSSIVSSNLSTSRVLVSDGSGKVAASAVTSGELGYLDGVTSSIQIQLNGKAASSHSHTIGNINDLRINNGELEFYDGGVWKSVGILPTRPRNIDVSLGVLDDTAWHTVGAITGKGKLNQIMCSRDPSLTQYRITTDGVVSTIGPFKYAPRQSGYDSPSRYFHPVKLDTYFKDSATIEVKFTQTYGNGYGSDVSLDYTLV